MKHYISLSGIFFSLLLLSFIPLWPVFYNGFLLVNSDSGAYIAHVFLPETPIDRSVFYSYFIKITSLERYLHFTIYAQSFLGVLLIFTLINQHFNRTKSLFASALAVIILSLLTPCAWFVSQLNPDIFMAYFALAFIGLYNYNLDPRVKYFLLVIILGCASIHNSILLFCLLYCGLGILYALLKKQRQLLSNFFILLMGSMGIYLLAAYTNYKSHGIFAPNPSSHVFIMSRLAEIGILNKVVAEECKHRDYELCSNFKGFKGRQWDFMWHGDYPHSNGKWLDSKVQKEYKELIKITFSNNNYLFEYIKINIRDAFLLLFAVKVDDGLQQFGDNSSPWNNIKTFYPRGFERFTKAKQQNEGINFEKVNMATKYGLILILLSCYLLY